MQPSAAIGIMRYTVHTKHWVLSIKSHNVFTSHKRQKLKQITTQVKLINLF